MPVKVKDAALEELETKIRKFLLYDRILNAFVLVYFLFMVLTLSLTSLIAGLAGIEMNNLLGGFFLVLGGLLALVFQQAIIRKRREYPVESDEWARYYTNMVYENLENSFKTSSGWKRSHRKKALSNAKAFLECIDERFTVGQFKPVRQFVGNSVIELKKNLRYRVIPAIKKGDEEILKQVSQIMYNFLYSPQGLSIEVLKEVNGQMTERLPNDEPFQKGRISRISTYVQTHKVVKHFIFILGFGVICVSLGYLGVTYLGIVKEYAWTGAIALFVGLLIVYFSRQPKPET